MVQTFPKYIHFPSYIRYAFVKEFQHKPQRKVVSSSSWEEASQWSLNMMQDSMLKAPWETKIDFSDSVGNYFSQKSFTTHSL